MANEINKCVTVGDLQAWGIFNEFIIKETFTTSKYNRTDDYTLSYIGGNVFINGTITLECIANSSMSGNGPLKSLLRSNNKIATKILFPASKTKIGGSYDVSCYGIRYEDGEEFGDEMITINVVMAKTEYDSNDDSKILSYIPQFDLNFECGSTITGFNCIMDDGTDTLYLGNKMVVQFNNLRINI